MTLYSCWRKDCHSQHKAWVDILQKPNIGLTLPESPLDPKANSYSKRNVRKLFLHQPTNNSTD